MSILDTPQLRPLIQENFLIQKFEDALFPELLFRSEADQEQWGENTGDTKIFTGNGLMAVDTSPTLPNNDARVADYGREQWSVTQLQHDNGKDTRMPDASQAAINLLVQDVATLGKNAGMTLNAIARNRMYNAALAGNTVADGAATSTTIRVKRLNGLTRARRPDLAGGSAVRFETVSASNPLPIRYGTTLSGSVNITGYTPDFTGDEIGPGTITVSASITVSDRDPIVALSATKMRRSGGGLASIDAIAAGDILTMSDIRGGLARLSNMSVPRHADGKFHCHFNSISNDQLFSDSEVKQVYQSVPDALIYKEHTFGQMFNCIFFQNETSPQPDNVGLGTGTSAGNTDGSVADQFTARTGFAGEMFATGVAATGVKVARALLTGGKWLMEYYVDQMGYLTDAGVNGVAKDVAPIISEGTATMATQVAHIKLIMRAPQDRAQQNVSTTWVYVGGLVCRTDAATGDAAYQKRGYVIEHADPS